MARQVVIFLFCLQFFTSWNRVGKREVKECRRELYCKLRSLTYCSTYVGTDDSGIPETLDIYYTYDINIYIYWLSSESAVDDILVKNYKCRLWTRISKGPSYATNSLQVFSACQVVRIDRAHRQRAAQFPLPFPFPCLHVSQNCKKS